MQSSSMLKVAALAVAVAVIFGCGTNNSSGRDTRSASYVASQPCFSCHSDDVDVNGVNIVSQWTASKHNTANGASCPDCHTTHGHPDGATLPDIPSDQVCLNCHTQSSMKTGDAHFAGADSLDPAKAAYVTPYDTNICRTCHNPHDMTTLMVVNKQWAASGHGNVTSKAWMQYKWRTASRNDCQRCHTAGGFRYQMTTGNLPTSAIFGEYTTGRETLGCKGCHTDYSFKRITPQNAFVTPYTPILGSNSFPNDLGDSALCIPCHAGLNSGAVDTNIDLTNTDFSGFDSHFMASAGMMFIKPGYTVFVNPATVIGTSLYGKSLTSNDDGGTASSTHSKLGTSAIIGNNGITAGDGLNEGGPCVVCHMKGGHTLGINAATYDRVCSHCHTSALGTALTNANFNTVFIEPQSRVFQQSLDLVAKLLRDKYGIEYNSTVSPYFYDTNIFGNPAVTDWTRGGTVDGTMLLGACYNLHLLKSEPAAFAHAPVYTRRLVYDTIDFLDDNVLNLSTGTTAFLQDPAHYSKGASAYTDGTLTHLANGTSEAMLYIIGWDRSSGAWTAIERP